MNDSLDWRKQQRKRLLAAREALPELMHQQWSEAISNFLVHHTRGFERKIIGIYWPFRGEYDVRSIARHFLAQEATLALPKVIGKHQPLHFCTWSPNSPMKDGAYGIPIPEHVQIVRPDAVIIPMVGFDQRGYRLGYGSGYYDRTLATYDPQPIKIGVAFEMQRLGDLHPQPHDIAMHYVVTEAGIFKITDDQLALTTSIVG